MHLVSVSDLTDIGMPPGDAIRLKEYSSRWWTEERQCVRKCPRDMHTTENPNMSPQALPLAADSTPPSKRLHFEKRFNDGGGMTVYGPAIRSGSWEDEDYMWWLYSKELKMYLPLPINKVPVLE